MTMRVLRVSLLLMFAGSTAFGSENWTDWRGPSRDGHSSETGLPSSWSPDGENLAWKAPYGGRSTPVILGDRLYVQNGAGSGVNRHERVQCFDVDSGELVWEKRINLFMSDVPPHRVGWASPVIDPSNTNVYAYTVGGTLIAIAGNGDTVWERSLTEEFGLITTHGGRTASPIIEGDLVIVSGLSAGWGEQARGSQRFFAFDKATGATHWVSSPGGRPYDTTYAPPYATEVNGIRLLMAGGGDGAMHAILPQTGESAWRFEYSKRGINSAAIVKNGIAIVSQGEENLNTSEMGLVAAIDATAFGDIAVEDTLWSVVGYLGSFSSPVLDGDRFYLIDNSANLTSFDFATGNQLWQMNLGTIQRSSPVFADGKLYVGTVNGKFYIIEPRHDYPVVLDEDELTVGNDFEEIYASAAVSDGRVYVVTSRNLYAIGPKERSVKQGSAISTLPTGAPGQPASVQVVPTELVLAPGESVELTARLYDTHGRFVRNANANWSLETLEGAIVNGRFTAESGENPQAGKVVAEVSGLSGAARLRIIPPLPWEQDFETIETVPRHWINATGKFEIREIEGNHVLVKKNDNPFLRRARVYSGPSEWSNYVVEADVMARKRRRQMGNVGVVAQRYQLTLFGNHQKLELQSWQPETERTARVPFTWQGESWYRMKLDVSTTSDGEVVARGKVWPRGEAEPSEWHVERRDEYPNLQGSPGIYADAQPEEIFLDNIAVRAKP